MCKRVNCPVMSGRRHGRRSPLSRRRSRSTRPRPPALSRCSNSRGPNTVKVVVFGANGATGRLVTRQLLDAGHTRGCRHQTTRHIPDQRPAVDGGRGRRLLTAGSRRRPRWRRRCAVGSRRAVHSPAGRHLLHGHRQHRRCDAPQRYSTPDRGQFHRHAALPQPEQLVAAAVDFRASHQPHHRQDRLRRPAPHGNHRRRQRPGLDDRATLDLDHVTDCTAGDVPPVGGFTARIDLAHYLTTLIDDASSIGATPIVSTTDGALSFWENMKRQAVKPASS